MQQVSRSACLLWDQATGQPQRDFRLTHELDSHEMQALLLYAANPASLDMTPPVVCNGAIGHYPALVCSNLTLAMRHHFLLFAANLTLATPHNFW